MPPEVELFRLLRAVMRFVDRHAEQKDGPGVIHVPLLPQEMRELRASLDPFRHLYRHMEPMGRKRIEEICEGAPPTELELAVRGLLWSFDAGQG